MIQLMWGEALAAIAKQKEDGSYDSFNEFPRCVENALNLITTKGEKKEAKVEGGGLEAVKYANNAYALEMSFRMGKENGKKRTLPFSEDEIDGVVDGIYALRVQPEDKTSGGLSVMEVIISTEDTFTAADGAIKKVTFDFIKPERNNAGEKVPTIDWDPIPELLAPIVGTEENASSPASKNGSGAVKS